MKRRTFLKLSPAFVALPLSLGLTGCDTSSSAVASATESVTTASSDSYTDTDIDEDDSLGMGLEEAKSYGEFSKCPFFIHRSDGLFYPLLPTLESNFQPVAFLSYSQLTASSECLTLCISDGDELVYISSRSVPDTVRFYPIDSMGNTIPVTLIAPSRDCPRLESLKFYSPVEAPHSAGYGNVNYRGYYSIPFSGYDSSCSSDKINLDSNDQHVTLNGLSLESILSTYADSDRLHFIAKLRNSMANVIAKEYLFGNYDNFPPEEEIDVSQLYNLWMGSYETIEWYEGTEYNSCTLNPSYVYLSYNTDASISCPLTLNPNGYATISLSALPSLPYSYIFRCFTELGAPNRAYLFIKP